MFSIKLSRNWFCPKDLCLLFALLLQQKNQRNLHLDTEKAKEANLEGGPETDEDSPAGSAHSSEDSYDWRSRRKTTDIIDSVKKRVAMRGSPSNGQCIEIVEESSSPGSQSEKNLTLEEKFAELVPEWRSLSPAAQQSLSLDRNRSLFKSAPTYNTLECMFGPSVSNTNSIYSAFDSSSSLYSSFRSCRGVVPGVRRNLSEHSEKSSCLECDSSESTADKDAEDDEKQEAQARRQRRREESSKRPGFFKSISSPSKIVNFVNGRNSSASSGSSSEDNAGHLNETAPSDIGEEKPFKTEGSCEPSPWPNEAKPPKRTLYKKSKTKPTSITLSSDDAESEEEKRYRIELQEIEEALKSPSLKNPFRKRSGALSISERPRSASAPNSPCFERAEADTQGNSST